MSGHAPPDRADRTSIGRDARTEVLTAPAHSNRIQDAHPLEHKSRVRVSSTEGRHALHAPNKGQLQLTEIGSSVELDRRNQVLGSDALVRDTDEEFDELIETILGNRHARGCMMTTEDEGLLVPVHDRGTSHQGLVDRESRDGTSRPTAG